MDSDLSYGSVTTTQLRFGEAIERIKTLLKDEGFGILCEIDVQRTLKDKLGVDFRPYVILGACNPQLAHHALSAESHLGLLLPCNVVVQEQDGKTLVSAVNAENMLRVVDNAAMEPLAREATLRLRHVIAQIAAG